MKPCIIVGALGACAIGLVGAVGCWMSGGQHHPAVRLEVLGLASRRFKWFTPNGIAADGTVVGTAHRIGSDSAFRWRGGSLHLVPTPAGASGTLACGANSHGDVAGLVEPGMYSAPYRCVFQTGKSGTIFLKPGANVLTCSGVDDAGRLYITIGQVSGPEAVVQHSGHWQALPSARGVRTSEVLCDDAGGDAGGDVTRAGSRASVAAVWRKGQLTVLGLPPGCAASETLAVNRYGDAVVFAGDEVGLDRATSGSAFFWRAGQWTRISGLGGPLTEPLGLNDKEEVVGLAWTSAGDSHAFLWTRAMGTVDLSTSASPTGCTLLQAVGVNDTGQVVGLGEHDYGDPREFVWILSTGSGP